MKADRVAYKVGDLVYHRTEDEPGIVTGILYTATGVEFRDDGVGVSPVVDGLPGTLECRKIAVRTLSEAPREMDVDADGLDPLAA